MLAFKRDILLCGLLVAALPLCAQNYGEINGTVSDPTGAVIAGATVTVTNTATNIARTVQTNFRQLQCAVPGPRTLRRPRRAGRL
jgi:hypothetical protein